MHNGCLATSLKLYQMDVVTPHLLPMKFVATRILWQVLMMTQGQNYLKRTPKSSYKPFPVYSFFWPHNYLVPSSSVPRPPCLTSSQYLSASLSFYLLLIFRVLLVHVHFLWIQVTCQKDPLMRLELSDGIQEFCVGTTESLTKIELIYSVLSHFKKC